MAQKRPITITDSEGTKGEIDLTAPPPYDGSGREVLVRSADGRELVIATDQLLELPGGGYSLPVTFTEYQNSGAGSGSGVVPPSSGGDSIVVPVVGERLEVSKRPVETGRVRLTKAVGEREEVIDEPLSREEVNVRRTPVGRLVEGALPEPRYEGDTLIIPVLEEVIVMEKRVMLKEEIRITKRSFETRNPQHVRLRTEEVNVERLRPEGGEGSGPRKE